MRSDQWVTVDIAARVVERTPRTIRRWITDGRVEALSLDGQTVVYLSQVLTVEGMIFTARHAAKVA